MNKDELEKISSVFTISDLELTVFPELYFALVLSNIISPTIWNFKNHPFFEKIENMSNYRKILRLKQFIVENFKFNLDYSTWGCCNIDNKLKRFENIINIETIKKYNAFCKNKNGKYYYDIDIRKHFRLDKYNSNIVPYFKSENLECMISLKNLLGVYSGECVSLSAFYIAALFVICKIPLENMFNIGFPLHSQNFLIIDDQCYITNNKRLITKNMWFNKTDHSLKAQRSLKHENMFMISNITGYLSDIYENVTIDKNIYNNFKNKLTNFLIDEKNEQTITPIFPNENNKKFIKTKYPIKLNTKINKDEIIDYLQSIRKLNEIADLALYCSRNIDYMDNLEPYFLANERCPICIEQSKNMSKDEIINYINSFKNWSIYGPNGLATVDEMWNCKMCSTFERNILLQHIFKFK